MALRAQPLKMGLHKITGLQDGTDAQDAVSVSQMQNATGVLSFRDYGAVADGGGVSAGTDNAVALNELSQAARDIEATENIWATIRFGPGIYDADLGTAMYFRRNHPRLKIDFAGGAFRNIYSGAANYSKQIAFGRAQMAEGADFVGNNEGSLIATTAVGDTTVTLTDPTASATPLYNPGAGIYFSGPLDIDGFAVGDWVIIASLTVQPAGSPANCYLFDIAQITANDGVDTLTLDRQIKNIHRSTFPDLWYAPPVNSGPPQGKARIWNLDQWDLFGTEHVIENGTILRPLGVTAETYPEYTKLNGRHIVVRDMDMPGYAISLSEHVQMINSTFRGIGEVDKLCDRVTMSDCEVHLGLNLVNPINNFTAYDTNFYQRSSYYTYGLQIGGLKNCTITGGYIQSLQMYTPLGFNKTTVLNNVHVGEMTQGQRWADVWESPMDFGTNAYGATMAYANGVITIDTMGATITATQGFPWSCVPGMRLNLSGPGDIYTGKIGDGIILDIEEGSSGGSPTLIITTSYQSAALPAWATGIRFSRYGNLTVNNCTGCDEILEMSEAQRQGKNVFGFYKREISGRYPASTARWVFGKPSRFFVNVKSAVIGAAFSKMNISVVCYDQTDLTLPTKTLLVQIDLTTAGLRDFDLSALTGKVGLDAVTLGGVAITALPADGWCYANMFISTTVYDPTTHAYDDLPSIDLQIEFDTQDYRKKVIGMPNSVCS